MSRSGPAKADKLVSSTKTCKTLFSLDAENVFLALHSFFAISVSRHGWTPSPLRPRKSITRKRERMKKVLTLAHIDSSGSSPVMISDSINHARSARSARLRSWQPKRIKSEEITKNRRTKETKTYQINHDVCFECQSTFQIVQNRNCDELNWAHGVCADVLVDILCTTARIYSDRFGLRCGKFSIACAHTHSWVSSTAFRFQ